MLTGHVDETFARTWNVLNKRLGKYSFSTVETGKDSVTAARGTVKVIIPLTVDAFTNASKHRPSMLRHVVILVLQRHLREKFISGTCNLV